MDVELRDWLAQHATEKDLAAYLDGGNWNDMALPPRMTRAQARYAFADAMLRAREKQPNA